jgi:hypothetical protein
MQQLSRVRGGKLCHAEQLLEVLLPACKTPATKAKYASMGSLTVRQQEEKGPVFQDGPLSSPAEKHQL